MTQQHSQTLFQGTGFATTVISTLLHGNVLDPFPLGDLEPGPQRLMPILDTVLIRIKEPL